MSHPMAGFGANPRSGRGATPSIQDGTHENPAHGILVVQVRHLGAISREVSESAAHETLVTSCRTGIRPWTNALDPMTATIRGSSGETA
jgi:hypothetical protein